MEDKLTAAKAREISEQSSITAQDAIRMIENVIRGQAKVQARSAAAGFPAPALDPAELDAVRVELEARGFEVAITSIESGHTIKVTW